MSDPAGSAVVTAPELSRLSIAGGELSIQRKGEGPPLLWMHDAGGSSQWHGALEAWSRDHDVIVPDHPGFGASDELDGIDTVTDLVYLYLELLDRLGLERVILGGASFGGWVAAELAVHSPERFSKLMLLSPLGLRIAEHPVADLFLMDPPDLAVHLFHDPEIRALAFPPDPSIDDIVAVYRDMGALALFGWGAPFLSNPKIDQRLHRVTMPTLVVWPEHDLLIPRAHAERYAELIPNARLEIVGDCGHALYYERPEQVAQVVARFLGSAGDEGASDR